MTASTKTDTILLYLVLLVALLSGVSTIMIHRELQDNMAETLTNRRETLKNREETIKSRRLIETLRIELAAERASSPKKK
jgi:uncharacterized protein HemX